MHTTHDTPSKEQIALLDPFERLGLDRIDLVTTPRTGRESLRGAGDCGGVGF